MCGFCLQILDDDGNVYQDMRYYFEAWIDSEALSHVKVTEYGFGWMVCVAAVYLD